MQQYWRKRADFSQSVWKEGLTKNQLRRQAGIGAITMLHKGAHRADIAWKVANAFAELTGISREEAFEKLFEPAAWGGGDPKNNPAYVTA